MIEEQTAPATPYLVDLEREEYIRFSLLAARIFGPMRGRTVMLCVMLLGGGLVAGLTVYDMVMLGQMDWLLFGLAIALIVLSIGFWLYIPYRLRRHAGREYDNMVACGYCYCGELQITDTAIVKIGEESTARVPLNGATMFVETEDMMAFISRDQRSIVLPARCLHKEMADRLRAAADRLPTASRRFLGRIQPQGQTVTAPISAPLTVLWEQTVSYTPQETIDILRARTWQQFWHRMPHLSLMGVLVAFMYGWSESGILPNVLIFLGLVGVSTLFSLVIPLSRLRRMQRAGIAPTPSSVLRVTLTDCGVRLTEGDRFACAPWSEIEHIYDRGDYAEMLWKQQFLRIPKRCIPDIEAFDALLKQHRKNGK